jgi:hypothetical protein
MYCLYQSWRYHDPERYFQVVIEKAHLYARKNRTRTQNKYCANTKMKLNVSPITLVTLKTDGTIRCLADVKYRPESRHSSIAFPLARNLADKVTAALVAQLGQDADTTASAQAQAQLYAVELHRSRIRICFDVFLDHCTPELRSQMNETAMRPIFVVAELGDGDGYHMDRKPPLDIRVSRRITGLQQFDKGHTRTLSTLRR